jgi:hypothetical protein
MKRTVRFALACSCGLFVLNNSRAIKCALQQLSRIFVVLVIVSTHAHYTPCAYTCVYVPEKCVHITTDIGYEHSIGRVPNASVHPPCTRVCVHTFLYAHSDSIQFCPVCCTPLRAAASSYCLCVCARTIHCKNRLK